MHDQIDRIHGIQQLARRKLEALIERQVLVDLVLVGKVLELLYQQILLVEMVPVILTELHPSNVSARPSCLKRVRMVGAGRAGTMTGVQGVLFTLLQR